MPKPEKHVFVCTNQRPPGHPKGSCTDRGCPDLLAEFGRLMEERGAFGPDQDQPLELSRALRARTHRPRLS